MKAKIFSLFISTLILSFANVDGALISFNYSGIVKADAHGDPGFFGGIPGDAFSGTFSYETDPGTNPDTTAGSAEVGTYSLTSFTLDSFTIIPGTVTVRNDIAIGVHSPADRITIQGTHPALSTSVIIDLIDHSGTAFSGDSLPTSLNLSAFEPYPISLIYSGGFAASKGELQAISVPSTPSTMLLLCSSLLGLTLIGWANIGSRSMPQGRLSR